MWHSSYGDEFYQLEYGTKERIVLCFHYRYMTKVWKYLKLVIIPSWIFDFTLCNIPPGKFQNYQTVWTGCMSHATVCDKILLHQSSLSECPRHPRVNAHCDNNTIHSSRRTQLPGSVHTIFRINHSRHFFILPEFLLE